MCSLYYLHEMHGSQLVSRAISCIHATVVYVNFCPWNHTQRCDLTWSSPVVFDKKRLRNYVIGGCLPCCYKYNNCSVPSCPHLQTERGMDRWGMGIVNRPISWQLKATRRWHAWVNGARGAINLWYQAQRMILVSYAANLSSVTQHNESFG